MQIIITQKNKKISVEFHSGKISERFVIDKADGFLPLIDKLIKKRRMDIASFGKAELRFNGAGLLTERVVRAIMQGLAWR